MANTKEGRFSRAKTAFNVVRRADAAGVAVTSFGGPLARFHVPFVEGFIAGEVIWQGILKPAVEFGRDLASKFRPGKSESSFRGSSARGASSLPVAA